jgi:hypothetical protein
MRKKGFTPESLSRLFQSLQSFVEFSSQQQAESTQLLSNPKLPTNFLLE